MEVVSTEAISTVTVELRAGGSSSNTFVILDGGDRLVASAGDESKSMRAVSEGVYEAEFQTIAGGTVFKISFERDDDDDAPGNEGSLPASFSLIDIPTDSPSRSLDDVTLRWTPAVANSDMKLSINDGCISPINVDVPGDPGSYTVMAGELVSTEENPKACDLQVTVTRQAEGTRDIAFDRESRFVLKQRRESVFTSAP